MSRRFGGPCRLASAEIVSGVESQIHVESECKQRLRAVVLYFHYACVPVVDRLGLKRARSKPQTENEKEGRKAEYQIPGPSLDGRTREK